ncbi:uncharacterized protein KY384_002522 [Bacidia gigantensis]|uniref:uncharacterized protein n=1 Tax=Bacidia gigantensis TaxID=2732470 RepID=UPI001D039381|nr:uncharacterized protein KY384_002522 [Bacidia gigantensis]KAG8532645.1 hypothetical protein KY384_002522 [Bacidia gigantensis]
MSQQGRTKYRTQVCLYGTDRRTHEDKTLLPREDIPDVAILGGGITGLATAYYLRKYLPHSTRIELFEGSSRLGGWLNSTSIDVGDGKVVLESGPRTLRPNPPNGAVTLDLVHDLGLNDEVISTIKNSPAARNRYVYYPDHLVRMPGPGSSILASLTSILREPLFEKTLSHVLSEAAVQPRPEDLEDESIGSFISRRFGRGIADNIVSALFHGIYAGDIYKLSARTIIPSLWHTESHHNSIMVGMLSMLFGGGRPISDEDFLLLYDFNGPLRNRRNHSEEARKSSVFTFHGGLGRLVSRLEAKLCESPNVFIHKQTAVSFDVNESDPEGGNLEEAHGSRDFSHVVSTVSSSALGQCLGDHRIASNLLETKSVTVMVVNLVFANPSILPVQGFGYLLPRSLPYEQNPELALGVIFDSDATPRQDTAQATKVTVMLGGHWWDDWHDYPDEEQGASMAKAILKRHLSIEEDPIVIRVSLHKNCIPQYHVGHDGRMASLGQELERAFSGKLRVAGSSYTGVGFNDCVRAARDVALGLTTGQDKTGLDTFVRGRKWSWLQPHLVKYD